MVALVLPAGAQIPERKRSIPEGRAELMYYNGKIITLSDKTPIAEAVTIADGRFLAVGTTQQVGRTTGPKTKQINLEGKTVVPGLIDAHVHPINAGLAERDHEIPVIRSFADIRAYVEEAVRTTPADKLVFVPKVYSTRLKERRYPTRWELDEFSGKHLVMLDNNYASALNSAALRAAGVERDTPEPSNGKIIRDKKSGEPTGLILGARQIVNRLVEQRRFDDEDRLWSLRKMQKAYSAAGLTSVIDRAQRPEGLRAYQRLWAAGEMQVRTTITIRLMGQEPLEKLREQILWMGTMTGFGDDFMRLGALKVVIDGGILIGTAYLRTPYGQNTEVYGYSDPDYRGVLRVPREKLFSIVNLAHELGWQMSAHTTGGGSTDLLLEAYEAADSVKPIRERRFTLIHSNFHTADSIAKAKRLGVVVDLQPAWYHFDGPALSKVLGPERLKTFQPYKSLLDAGLVVAGGSDHMIKFDSRTAINPYHPFYGMWMVISRKTADGTVFNPEQKISREQALKMWTWNAAYHSFDEDIKGSIEPGKLADMVIISKDYLTCPEDEISNIEALATIVGGRTVYER
jgi:predicted amidohydrolase YtcJ